MKFKSDTLIVGVFGYGEETRNEFVTTWRSVTGDVPAYSDYEKMLSDLEPDLLCVATRQTMHADQIEIASKSGVRGILCDKPLVTSLAEMDRLRAACADIPLCFALDRRWAAPYLQLRERIPDLVGKITGIVAYGLLNTINHGCHWYDAILGLLGDPEPSQVSGSLVHIADSDDDRRKMDPPAHAQITFENGVTAYVTPDGDKASFEITGERGRLSIHSDADSAYLWSDERYQKIDLPSVEGPWPTGPAG